MIWIRVSLELLWFLKTRHGSHEMEGHFSDMAKEAWNRDDSAMTMRINLLSF
jgi:hypothetical protein